MQLCSLPFVVFVVLGLSLYHACWTIRQRRFTLLLLNGVFLSSHVTSLGALAPLSAFLGLSVLAVFLVDRFKSRGVFLSCLAVLIGLFLYLKKYLASDFLPVLPVAYVSIGLSFLVFRVLHVLIDTHQRDERSRDLAPASLLGYFTAFLALTAGPIQRFDDYLEQEQEWHRRPRLDLAALGTALLRLPSGYLKLVWLGPLIREFHAGLYDRIAGHPLAFAGAALSYTLFVYVNFSGYMDVVIGLGKLFGMQLPENFNAPFLSANFLDLWNRWHISLCAWFKDYVFTPTVRALCSWFPHPALVPYYGVASYFLVFFLLGLWHGSDPRYLVLGSLFGIGASANKLFQVEMARRLGMNRYQALTRQPAYQALARALALSFHAFAAAVVWEELATLGQFGDILKQIGVTGLATCFLASVVGIMAVEALVRTAVALGRRIPSALPGGSLAWSGRALAIGGQALLVLWMLCRSGSQLADKPATGEAATAPAASVPAAPAPRPTDVYYAKWNN